jgi:hypothetical protein
MNHLECTRGILMLINPTTRFLIAVFLLTAGARTIPAQESVIFSLPYGDRLGSISMGR